MDIVELIAIIPKIDRVTALIIILWAGHKGHWRFGYQFAELERSFERAMALRDAELEASEQQRREWKALAENLLGHADKAVAKVETK